MISTNDASDAQFHDEAHLVAPDPSKSEASFPRNKLLAEFRDQFPQLEDAFIVPGWFVQQTSWLKDPANSDSAVYNYPLLFAIRGRLNSEALARSLNEVVRRHQVLRSVFRTRDEDLVQIVLPPQEQSFSVVDLLRFPRADREERMQSICYEEARRAFDLAHGPLLRSVLIRLAPDYHLLQLTIHHLVHDDWSTGILLHEITELYYTFATDIAPPLDYLPFQYSDYVRWLEEQLKEEEARSRFAHWEKALTTSTKFHHLATDFPRSAGSAHRGARETILLPGQLAESLKLLSRRERVSMFMVLLAGFQALLHRYSEEEEIGVASCAANRPLPQVEGLMGRFGNHIFLRTSFTDNPTFREVLERLREVALDAYSDQGLPFAQILKGTASKLSFQVMFILHNAQREQKEIPGLSIRPFPFYAGMAKNDLTVLLKIMPALEVILEYKADLFRVTTIKQLLVDYRAILETMTDNPSALVSSFIPLRPPDVLNEQTISNLETRRPPVMKLQRNQTSYSRCSECGEPFSADPSVWIGTFLNWVEIPSWRRACLVESRRLLL